MALPTPLYDDGQITIYCGDSREIAPLLNVDRVVTDPPYGINDAPLATTGSERAKRPAAKRNTWHPESTWDANIDHALVGAAAQCAPVVAWFGRWNRRDIVESSMPYPLRAEIVWAKNTHVGPPCPLSSADERIWLFAQHGIVGKHHETTVWREPIIPTWSHKHHKNQKPLALMRRLLSWMPGTTTVDICMGSGSTVLAADALDLPCIGIDLSLEYCKIAVERLHKQREQLGKVAPDAAEPGQQIGLFACP